MFCEPEYLGNYNGPGKLDLELRFLLKLRLNSSNLFPICVVTLQKCCDYIVIKAFLNHSIYLNRSLLCYINHNTLLLFLN